MEIRIEGMTTAYGDVVAVNDLDLEISSGEMLVLLGPSGCGKTSTMRSIVGLENPRAGRITFGDSTVFDARNGINVPVHKRHAGMVFQSYAIWPHMTVFENVAFALRMQRLPKTEIRLRVDEALGLVGLEGTGARGASRLSGGQMQRVALARSLVMRPRVLLLDEPLSNLDARLRDQLRFELRELQQELQLTSVYVTHDQAEALALADRIAVMDEGAIVQLDTPSQVYKEPNSVFVADFLGVKNIFAATLGQADSDGLATATLRDFNVEFLVNAGGHPPGDIHVCIRPDAIDVKRANSRPEAGSNKWPGKVHVASFLGTHTQYRVKIALDGPMVDVVSYEKGEPSARDADVLVSLDPGGVALIREPAITADTLARSGAA